MHHMKFSRLLQKPKRSFFLLGPRATGKSTWLKTHFANHLHFDLLRNDVFFTLSSDPSALRERVLTVNAKKTWIIIDEIQRLPILLNDVHSLIENEGYQFALSGSSARKLKRGQANLLAGRALVKHFFPLTFAEYQQAISIDDALQFGTLPSVIDDPETRIEQLEAYVGTYLREEIKEEALSRNVQSFSRVLEVAGLMNGQVTNLSNIARDASVPRATVTTYFEILVDTLLGSWLPAWTPRAKVKEVSHPKFYFFDCGVVRAIQKLLRDPPSKEERGYLFETFIINELRAFIDYYNVGGELFYWRTQDGIEVDCLWKRGKTVIALEIKSTDKWKNDYNTGFKSLLSSSVPIKKCYGIYCGNEILQKEFGSVLPWNIFLQRLYQQQIGIEC